MGLRQSTKSIELILGGQSILNACFRFSSLFFSCVFFLVFFYGVIFLVKHTKYIYYWYFCCWFSVSEEKWFLSSVPNGCDLQYETLNLVKH